MEPTELGIYTEVRGNRCAFTALCSLRRTFLLIALTIGILGTAATRAMANEQARTIAVGPFFAPEANESLRQVSATIPDLLTVELSQQDGFRLVEREKVTAIWKELNLSASGMVTADTVAKLGNVLACDWLITGTLVPSNTRTQVWVKIVDVKSSLVLDLETLPFDAGNLTAAIQGIAGFVSKARSHHQAKGFITLGRITDLSSDTSHEDWGRHIRTLIEQHCRDAGVGLVEREAVAPIFEEFQFERAGLTGSPTNGIRLQPAFWIVDGAWKLERNTDNKVHVTLRLHKVGGQEHIIEIIKGLGPELDNAVIATVQSVLSPTTESPSDDLSLNESKLHYNRGIEAADANDRFSRFHYDLATYTDARRPDPQRSKDLAENRQFVIESFQKALLLNPKDVRAKYMLGFALIGDHDRAQVERGKELLKEVAALNDPEYSKRAALYAEYPEMFHPDITVGGTTNASAAAREARRAKAFQAEALERVGKAYERDPRSTQAKLDFAFVLVNETDEAQKNRGKQLLKEIVALNDPAYSKLADRRLELVQIEAQGGRMTEAQMAKRDRDALEAFERQFQLNPTSVRAKFGYASALLGAHDEGQRNRGKELLKEVVAVNDPSYSKNAASILRYADRFVQKPAAVSAKPTPAPGRPTAVESESEKIEKRVQFLQQNFAKFVPVEFQQGEHSEAKIQYLHVKENLFEHEGRYYCGFQFTVPEWLDGDFEWMQILAITETNKDLSIKGMQWYIVPKSGRSQGFEYFRRDAVASYPRLKQRFPFTNTMFVQDLDKNRLQAGKTYAIWFSFVDQNVCDIAFAMTIDSERGAKEFGALPLR